MRVLWIAGLVVFLDQLSKATVLRFMHPGQSIHLLGDWFKFTFTENPGMAFGLTFGPKGMVTVFAIIATLLVGWYLYRVRATYWPYAVSLTLILGGAIGNIIDRVFYGVLLGYDQLFMGRVVDFIHVDVGYLSIPEAIPLIGDTHMALFPIWNVADMAIVLGVVGILVFQGTFHKRQAEAAREEHEAQEEAAMNVDTPAAPSPTVRANGSEQMQAAANPDETPDSPSSVSSSERNYPR